MPKLPALASKKVIALLKRHGFQMDRSTGSHYIFYHPEKHRLVTVPFHNKDLPKGTLHAILKQAGIDFDE